MSTTYAPLDKILASHLFDGRLNKLGVYEHIEQTESTERRRCLTDGRNYVWVYIDTEGIVKTITRYGANAPGNILGAISETFDVDIVSEYEPQFYGFETQEEWDSWQEALSRKSEDEFYGDLMKYLMSQPCSIRQGTIGEIKAKIARQLVTNDPDLMKPEKRDHLMRAIREIYDRDHTVGVTLSDQDIAKARMAVTHEDDLPQA
jgi:hypothetical protein